MQNDKKRSRFRSLLNSFLRLLGKKPPQMPGDPYAYAMAPVRRGPQGRSSAAVAEIEEDSYQAFPPRRL